MPDTPQQQVLRHIDGDWITDQTERLVQVPSVTMHEQAVCRMYEQQLIDLGLEVDVRPVTDGRPNLYACLRGTGGGPALMLNGHLDTIPNQNNQPVYRDGDLLYGRGTTDMKGGMAAVLGAARAVLASGVRLRGDLWITAVVGHEEPEARKDGPLTLIDDLNSGRVAADRILIVEGPDALWVMSMGSMVFTITLDSPQGGTHTQYIPLSENPIRFVGDLIHGLHGFQQELDGGAVHPLAGPERIDLGIVQAGDYFNRTPNRCVLTGTRRWAPGKQADDVLSELQDLVTRHTANGGLTANVSMEHQREPFETPADDPLVSAISQAHEIAVGGSPEIIGKRIVGDANLYVHGANVPTVYYGPSNETAHADIENVSIRRVTSAAQVYALTALSFCQVH